MGKTSEGLFHVYKHPFFNSGCRFIIIGNDWGLVFKCENEHPCTSFECCKLGISMLNIRFSHQYYWGTV